MVVSWDKVQEDEADKAAFKYLMDARYDVREVPKLYMALEGISARDTRATLGFLGQRNRVKERKTSAEELIAQAYKADIELQLKNGGFSGDSAAHRNLMAELKRDNGIMAYYHDMFSVARKNLEEAVAIRANDPAAQYYLGKTLETIGRTVEDRKAAEAAFGRAVQYDDRRENFGSHLHYALLLMGDENPNTKKIAEELDTYVTNYVKYQAEYASSLLLPPNLATIYDYMRTYGDSGWKPRIPEEAKVIPASLPPGPEVAKEPVTPPSGTLPAKPAPGAAPAPGRKGGLPACPPGIPSNRINGLCAAAGQLAPMIKK
jgi:hypothetical protein